MTDRELLEKILTAVEGHGKDITDMKGHMGRMESHMNRMESRMDGMEVQLDENTQIVKALRHSQEYMLAKLDGLEATTAKVETVQKLQASVDLLHGKYNVLNCRLFVQEAQTSLLMQRIK